MKKRLILLLISIVGIFHCSYSQFYLFIGNIDRGDASIYYKHKAGWFVATPFAFSSRKFSPDYGSTWQRVGMFGQKVKPFISDNIEAKKSLNTYKALRITGFAQTLLAPTILIYGLNNEGKHSSEEDKYNPGLPTYVAGYFIFLYTGSIFSHLIAEPFIKKTLRKYYSQLELKTTLDLKPNLGLNYDYFTGSPTLSLRWNF